MKTPTIFIVMLLICSFGYVAKVIIGEKIPGSQIDKEQLKTGKLEKEMSLTQEINLAEINAIAPKGRVQDKDYNPNLIIVDKLVAKGVESIPFLIKNLGNSSKLPKPVIGLWSKNEIGDIALIILTDFFTDEDWKKTTIPGVSWNEILEIDSAQSLSAEDSLRRYVKKHGREKLVSKWAKIWNENKDRVYWDVSARCFKRK